MKTIKLLAFLTLSISSISIINAQTSTTQSNNEGSIDDQFNYVLRKSGNFRGTNGQMYEAVSRRMLLDLQLHTSDSLKTLQAKLDTSKSTINQQLSEISSLKTNLINTQLDLDQTTLEKNNMSMLGVSMSKTSYSLLMWSLITALLTLLIIFIVRFKNSNAITKAAKKSLLEIEDAFEEHRRTALEREQKVRRQLQDELNKQKGGN
jgi:hypothetical protein